MKTSTKLAIVGAIVLVLGGGGIALAISLKKKDEPLPGDKSEENNLGNTTTIKRRTFTLNKENIRMKESLKL